MAGGGELHGRYCIIAFLRSHSAGCAGVAFLLVVFCSLALFRALSISLSICFRSVSLALSAWSHSASTTWLRFVVKILSSEVVLNMWAGAGDLVQCGAGSGSGSGIRSGTEPGRSQGLRDCEVSNRTCF